MSSGEGSMVRVICRTTAWPVLTTMQASTPVHVVQ